MNVKWTPINFDYKYKPNCIIRHEILKDILYCNIYADGECIKDKCKFCKTHSRKEKHYSDLCPFMGIGAFTTFRDIDYVNALNIFRILRFKYYSCESIYSTHIPSLLRNEKMPKKGTWYYLYLHNINNIFAENSATLYKTEKEKVYLVTHLFDKDKIEKLYEWAKEECLIVTELISNCGHYDSKRESTLFIISAQ